MGLTGTAPVTAQDLAVELLAIIPGEGTWVTRRSRVWHMGDGVLLEPIAADVDEWFAELDRFADVPLFEDGRNKPLTPADEDLFG